MYLLSVKMDRSFFQKKRLDIVTTVKIKYSRKLETLGVRSEWLYRPKICEVRSKYCSRVVGFELKLRGLLQFMFSIIAHKNITYNGNSVNLEIINFKNLKCLPKLYFFK